MEPISAISSGLSSPNPIGSSGLTGPSGKNISFNEIFSEMVDQTNNNLQEADSTVKDFVEGRLDNPQDLMIKLEEAHLSLQFTIQMRNRIVEAYQEMMRMQL